MFNNNSFVRALYIPVHLFAFIAEKQKTLEVKVLRRTTTQDGEFFFPCPTLNSAFTSYTLE